MPKLYINMSVTGDNYIAKSDPKTSLMLLIVYINGILYIQSKEARTQAVYDLLIHQI